VKKINVDLSATSLTVLASPPEPRMTPADRERIRAAILEQFSLMVPPHFRGLVDAFGDEVLARKLVGGNLFIHGAPGSGKTVLGLMALRLMALRRGTGMVRFLSCPDFIFGLQGDYEAANYEVREVMRFPGWLMLDDFGAEKLTDFTRQTYYLIINHREQWDLPTIITSNLNLNEVDAWIDRRLSSRIAGMCGKDRIIERAGDRRLAGKK